MLIWHLPFSPLWVHMVRSVHACNYKDLRHVSESISLKCLLYHQVTTGRNSSQTMNEKMNVREYQHY